mmetsp:Transcript_95407/g.246601  ORF Transcript_95407/g.246601 Transcript_95407/m.246601 type:complete len:210 (-) Transcript_95407:1391-2020(-)
MLLRSITSFGRSFATSASSWHRPRTWGHSLILTSLTKGQRQKRGPAAEWRRCPCARDPAPELKGRARPFFFSFFLAGVTSFLAELSLAELSLSSPLRLPPRQSSYPCADSRAACISASLSPTEITVASRWAMVLEHHGVFGTVLMVDHGVFRAASTPSPGDSGQSSQRYRSSSSFRASVMAAFFHHMCSPRSSTYDTSSPSLFAAAYSS